MIVEKKASCDVDVEAAAGPLYWGRSRAFWTRIVVALVGAMTMIAAAWLGRSG